ncbi:MAG: hypothetical protein M3008_10425, partial [Chloroflexota bacterium]|nr:hypothetical protein [Chloroflexota bacterium]
LNLGELADVVMQLRCGVDRVVWLIGDDGAYMVVTRADIAVVEDFIADRTDTLALPGGTLDEEWAR